MMSLRDGAQDDVYEVLLRDRLYEYYTVNIEKDPYSHGVLKLLEQTMTKHQALLTLHEMTLIQDRIKKQHEIDILKDFEDYGDEDFLDED